MQSIRILAGSHKKRRLDFAPREGLRPTSHRLRETVFNILIHRFYPQAIGQPTHEALKEKSVLDLFAGVGSYGFEALSRGASYGTFVESCFATTTCLSKTAASLGMEKITRILCGNAENLDNLQGPFSLIFMDPPYTFSQERIIKNVEKIKRLINDESIIVLESILKEEDLIIEGLNLILSRGTREKKVFFFTMAS